MNIYITILACMLILLVIVLTVKCIFFNTKSPTVVEEPFKVPGDWHTKKLETQKWVTQTRVFPKYKNLIFSCSRNSGLAIYRMGTFGGGGDEEREKEMQKPILVLKTNAIGVEGLSLNKNDNTLIVAKLGKANEMVEGNQGPFGDAAGFYVFRNLDYWLRFYNEDSIERIKRHLNGPFGVMTMEFDHFIDITPYTNGILHCEFFYHSNGSEYIIASSGFADDKGKDSWIVVKWNRDFPNDDYVSGYTRENTYTPAYGAAAVHKTDIAQPEGVILIPGLNKVMGGGIGMVPRKLNETRMVTIDLDSPLRTNRPTTYMDDVGGQLVPGNREEYVQPSPRTPELRTYLLTPDEAEAQRGITFVAGWGCFAGNVIALNSSGEIIGDSGRWPLNRYLNRVIPFGRYLFCPLEQHKGGIVVYDTRGLTHTPQRGVIQDIKQVCRVHITNWIWAVRTGPLAPSAIQDDLTTYCMTISAEGIIYLFCANDDNIYITTVEKVLDSETIRETEQLEAEVLRKQNAPPPREGRECSDDCSAGCAKCSSSSDECLRWLD